MAATDGNPGRARWLAVAAALLVLALMVFNLFYKLQDQILISFDEGRHIASALEMRHNHDFLVNRFMGHIDYYNAKPPLSMWAAALTVGLVPDPFIGVRLFSLLAAMATALFAFIYVRRMAGYYAGLLAAALLMTAPLLLLKHGARTADPDMLYVMLVTAALLPLASGRRHGIAAAYVLLGLAFMAKSFHAMPFMMAAFLYCAGLRWRGQLGTRELLLLPFWALLPILPWAIARYGVDGTQFFHVMFFYDLVARTSHSVESHFSPPSAYADTLLITYGPAVLSAVICLFAKNSRSLFRDSRTWLLLCWLLLPLGLYSAAQSRVYWYVFPMLPPAAMLLSLIIARAWRGVPDVAYVVAVIVLGFNLVINEQAIYDAISAYSWSRDAVQQGLRQLSANTPGRVGIFMGPQEDDHFSQARYATALLLGNIDYRGPASAFAAAAGPGDVLVTADGLVHPWRPASGH